MNEEIKNDGCDKHENEDCMQCFYTTAPQETNKGWEQRFDYNFKREDKNRYPYVDIISYEPVKTFISQELSLAKKEVLDKMEKRLPKRVEVSEDWETHNEQLEHNGVIEDVEKIITTLRKEI